jgi:hypothetical protein
MQGKRHDQCGSKGIPIVEAMAALVADFGYRISS